MYNNEIIALVKKKFTFIDIIDYRIIDNIICISCDIDNKIDYFILYPQGEIKYKYYDDWSYISEFNQKVCGNGIIFIDKQTLDIIIISYYKDDLCLCEHVKITYSTSNFIVTEHEERTHVIFTDDFSVLSFGVTNYKIYENFILFFPYDAYLSYDTFCILDVKIKKRVDLDFIIEKFNIKSEYNRAIGSSLEGDLFLDENNEHIIYRNKYKFNIKEVFDIKSNIKNKLSLDNINRKLYNIQKLPIWDKAFSIDIQTVQTILNENGSFDTIRSDIGELLYQIKYKYNKILIPDLSKIVARKIKELFGINIDVIIPIPPSNLNRPYQPVVEIAKEISKILSISCDLTYLQKKPTIAIKSIDDNEERIKILKDSFSIRDKSYEDKTILLFDDLYRSGSTIKGALDILMEKGEIYNILVLTITKTRTKR